ncbi:putative transcription factor TGA like domain-containing protein [Medicago truncatula]|uniref:Putative transcription factor TGA like domain-containing protein n=1 Tax=Medicago truncatula TaxID=3880 RepID=A0A396HU17_MEDTR|nr:transcription factor TGA7-like isoform X2 [Medicago truncatula]RHN56021.1 putative transcription factor TGA like domain-containing protein [Medicago truncatula]
MGSSRTINSGISLFEIEYGRWIEEQDRQNEELRNALQTNASDIQLHLLVESSLNQYSNLFRMKAEAAKIDSLYLISGAWKKPLERLFLWFGGSCPSQLLNIVVPKLDALTDQQIVNVNNLRLSSLQAEDALTEGLEKLQQSMINNIQADPLDFGNYGFQMAAAAIEKVEALESFVNQADHLRQQTLVYMSRILTIVQAAQGLLAMGDYFHRLRTCSSLWTSRSCISLFEIEYGRWIEEQDRQNKELRNALHNNASDIQLHLLVESSLNQYSNLFRMKAEAAKTDVFYLISGVWKKPLERLFLWFGGYHPSQLLNIIVPKVDALTDQQIVDINNLRLSILQAEEALTQVLEKIKQSMISSIQADPMDFGNHGFQMAAAMDKVEAVPSFIIQADHLRQETLVQMSHILTIRQAAQGFLAMGGYFHLLRNFRTRLMSKI